MIVEVSYGEAIDKITILQLKIHRIKNQEKVATAQEELISLTAAVSDRVLQLIATLREQLLYINGILWWVEDDLREKEARNEFDHRFITLAREVYHLNDRRAQIKHAIDLQLLSTLREVKSYSPYAKEPIFLFGHLGMGDQLIMNGMVRYVAMFHSRVVLVARKIHKRNMEFMYRDIADRIGFHWVADDNEIDPLLGADVEIIKKYKDDGFRIIFLGQHTIDGWCSYGRDFAEAFYQQAGIDYSVRGRYFFVPRDRTREHRYYETAVRTVGNQYIFLHDDPERNLIIHRDHPAISSLPIFHPNDSTVNLLTTDPDGTIFDYCEIIEKACELHTMDSSFAILADSIGAGQRRVLHSYVKTDVYPFLYINGPWEFVGTHIAAITALIATECIVANNFNKFKCRINYL